LIYSKAKPLVAQYGSSCCVAVMDLFPEHAWQPWLFKQTIRNWWSELGVLFKASDPIAQTVTRNYLDQVERKLRINHPKDWQLVKNNSLNPIYPHMKWLGGLVLVLQKLYPTQEFEFKHQLFPRQGEYSETISCA